MDSLNVLGLTGTGSPRLSQQAKLGCPQTVNYISLLLQSVCANCRLLVFDMFSVLLSSQFSRYLEAEQ